MEAPVMLASLMLAVQFGHASDISGVSYRDAKNNRSMLVLGDSALNAAEGGLSLVAINSDGAKYVARSGAEYQSFVNIGGSITVAPDITGDGIPEILVGAAWCTEAKSRCMILADGASLRILRTHKGSAVMGEGGMSAAQVGDCNGDNVPDYAIGVWSERGDPGCITIFSGKDGSVVRAIHGRPTEEHLGISISVLDGHGDGSGALIATARDSKDRNQVRVRMVKLPGLEDLRDVALPATYDVGWSVLSSERFKVPRYVLTATRASSSGDPIALLEVRSGVNDEALFETTADDWSRLGHSWGQVADWNHDSIPDYAVGMPGKNDQTGAVRVISGSDGKLIEEVNGPPIATYFGTVLVPSFPPAAPLLVAGVRKGQEKEVIVYQLWPGKDPVQMTIGAPSR
jgi:hypothetical protein